MGLKVGGGGGAQTYHCPPSQKGGGGAHAPLPPPPPPPRPTPVNCIIGLDNTYLVILEEPRYIVGYYFYLICTSVSAAVINVNN